MSGLAKRLIIYERFRNKKNEFTALKEILQEDGLFSDENQKNLKEKAIN